MHNSMPTPKTLEDWLTLLDNTKLPVPCGHKLRVERALLRQNSSLREIASVVSSAPSIALIFFREANRVPGVFNGAAQHLEAVLTRLGMTRCRQLLGQLEDTPDAEIPLQLRKIWLIGEHANAQATALFSHKLARVWQEIHWSSLLFLAPLWPLLTRYPQLFALWEQRVMGGRQSRRTIEQELFGTSLARLCQAVAEHWILPDWIVEAYAIMNQNPRRLAQALRIARLHDSPLRQQLLLDENKDIFLWLRQPANTILISNGLAIDAHYSWHHEHCTRWQRFAALFLESPLDRIQAQTHRNAVEHARSLGKSGLWHPAQALLWPPLSKKMVPVPEGTATHAPAPRSACPVSTEQQQQWQLLARRMLQRPSHFSNLHQFVTTVFQMLYASGFQRIALLAVQGAEQQLKLLHQTGFGFSRQQVFKQQPQSSLLKKLLQPNGILHITAAQLPRLQAGFPAGLLTALESSSFVSGTICLDGKTLMLLIADADNATLHTSNIKAFQASCKYAGHGLAIMQQRL